MSNKALDSPECGCIDIDANVCWCRYHAGAVKGPWTDENLKTYPKCNCDCHKEKIWMMLEAQ